MRKKNRSLYFLWPFILAAFSTLCLAQRDGSPRRVLPSMMVQEEKQWQRYTAKGEEFSVAMPQQPFAYSFYRPLQRDYPLSLYANRKSVRLYGAYSNGAVYVIMSSDNPRGNEALEVFIDEFQQYPVFHNEMTYERDVARHNFKGKQYRVKSNYLSGIVQFYQTKDHVYIFEVVEDIFGKPLTGQFLSSLKLDGKTKGKDIAEGFAETAANPRPSATPAASEAPGPTPAQKETFASRDVTRKALIIVKVEPQYTEDARKNAIAGTVVIKAVFSSTGALTNIRVISGLPFGLTEKAVLAARLLKFIPAIKDGKYVSQYVQIEYNFSLF
jgi:TonB family protein